MRYHLLCLLVLAASPALAKAQSDELRIAPLIVQNAMLVMSDHITAGGVGGGLGLVAVYREVWVAQLDVSALFGFGNAVAARAALGVQQDGEWSPALGLTFSALFGDRIEFLTGEGQRPPHPAWSVGLRAAPLRFGGTLGEVSLLEPGVATDFSGALWLDLTLLRACARL
jgi:hypothetical protein